MKLVFDWDEDKARTNRLKHKITFDEARTVFGDPLVISFPDESHSVDEQRFISIGISREKQQPRNDKTMRKRSIKTNSGEMSAEYDFSGKKGVRGKYYEAYRQGHTVRVRKTNGTVDVKYFTLEDGAVMLEPDVKKHFPDSGSVNRALRKLIPAKQSRRRASQRPR